MNPSPPSPFSPPSPPSPAISAPPPSPASLPPALSPGRRSGFVLLMAIGVVGALMLLMIALSISAQSGQNQTRFHTIENRMVSVRRSLETLANAQAAEVAAGVKDSAPASDPIVIPGPPDAKSKMPSGNLILPPWDVYWSQKKRAESAFAKASIPEGSQSAVLLVTASQSNGIAAPVVQEILLIRAPKGQWKAALWRNISEDSPIPSAQPEGGAS